MALYVLYFRVSTEEQARGGYSLPEQARACRARAAELARAVGDGEPAIVEFEDDISGDVLERPALQAALELVRSQRAAHFICLDPDRLARRLMLQLLITDEIESAGCRIEFVQHNYQDTPEGRLFYQLRGAIAEFEKAKILERMTRGARGKIKAGGLPHGVRLYGYDFRPGAGKAAARDVLTPNPQEAEWVRTMFRWCAEEGLGPLAIANRLNELGVRTKTGRGKWMHGQVRRILRNEVYASGRLTLLKRDHRGIFVARRLPVEERRRKGIALTAKPKPPDQWLSVDVEPVIAPELFRAAQEVLAGFRVGGRAENDPRKMRMLTGLGRCGVCGSPLMYLSGRKIVCAGRYRHHFVPGSPRSACSLPAKPREAVESAVWAVVRSWVTSPDLLREAADAARRESVAPDRDREQISREIVLLEEQERAKRGEVERIGLLYARGLWPAEQALPALEEANRELAALNERLSVLRRSGSADARPGEPESPLRRMLADPGWLKKVRATLPRLTAAKRIELVRLMVGRYTLHPTGRGQPPRVTVEPRV